MRRHKTLLATAFLAALSLFARADAQAPHGDGKSHATLAASKSLLQRNAPASAEQGWRLKFTLRGHTGAVYSAAIFPDGGRLVTSGDDGNVRVWDLRTGRLVRKIVASKSTVSDVAVSSDGHLIAACTDDDEVPVVKIWDARTFRLLRTLKGHDEGVFEVAFAPTGRLLASGGRDKTIKLWDAGTGRLLRTLEGHTDAITSLAFTPDGHRLASAGAEKDNTVRLWEVSTGRLLRTLTGHDDWVTSVAVSPGGETLASGSRDKKIILWDARTGEKLHTLTQPEMVYELEFSPDGKMLAEGGGGHNVRLHDARTGKLLGTLEAHSDEINDVKFSSRGTLLVTASYDSTVKVWERRPNAANAADRGPRAKWLQ